MLGERNHSSVYARSLVLTVPNLLLLCLVKIRAPHTCFCIFCLSFLSLKSELWAGAASWSMLHSLPYCMRLGISRRLAAWAARAGDAGALPGLLPESWQYVSKLIISHKKSDFRIIILWPPNKTFNCKLHLFLNIQPKLSLKLILRFSQLWTTQLSSEEIIKIERISCHTWI